MWFLLPLSVSVCYGQKTEVPIWSLSQCLEYAKENNLSVKRYSVLVEQREVSVSSARASLLPVVSGSASQTWGFGRALTAANVYEQRNTSNTHLGIGASAVLFQGLQRRRSIEQSRLNLDVAKEDKRRVEEDLELGVVIAYLNVLMSDELRQVSLSHLRLSSAQRGLIERQAELGRLTAVDVLRAKATEAQDSMTFVSASNDYELSLVELWQLLDVPYGSFYVAKIPVQWQTPESETSEDAIGEGTVSELVGDVQISDADTCHRWASFPAECSDSSDVESAQFLSVLPDSGGDDWLSERPEIRAAELRLAAAEKQVSISRSLLFPTLKLNVGVNSSYYKTDGWLNGTFAEQMRGNFSQSVSLSLNVPIFDAFSTRNTVRQAQLQRTQSEIDLSMEKRELEKKVEQAYCSLKAAKCNYESAMLAATASQRAYEMVKSQFVKGRASRLELDEALSGMTSANAQLVIAKYEKLLRTKVLEHYVLRD